MTPAARLSAVLDEVAADWSASLDEAPTAEDLLLEAYSGLGDDAVHGDDFNSFQLARAERVIGRHWGVS